MPGAPLNEPAVVPTPLDQLLGRAFAYGRAFEREERQRHRPAVAFRIEVRGVRHKEDSHGAQTAG